MNSLMYLVFAPIIIGVLMYAFKIRNKYILIALQFSMILAAIGLFSEVKQYGVVRYVVGGWDEVRAVGITLYVDKLASIMIFLTAFFFTLFELYDFNSLERFLMLDLFILITEGLVIALFASNDLFNIFILLEISTLLITSLIMYKKNFVSYYDGLVYLLVNIIGMSFFLLGVAYIYRIYGVFDITKLGELIVTNVRGKEYIMPYVLLMTGILFKLGVMPVFSWLPRAHGSYSAPTIVSAFLSGLYINIAFIIFIKLQTIFLPVIDARILFVIIGILTALSGAFFALTQHDIKRILAYSTVSQIGLILIGLNLDSQVAYYGSLYHIISHSIFKTLLFLVAGVLINIYETRKIENIRGLVDTNPVLALSMIAGILGITGAPFFNGSIGKYLIGEGIENSTFHILFYIINFLTIVYLSKFLMTIFGGKKKVSPMPFKIKPIVVLAILCFVGGIAAPNIMNYVFNYTPKININLYIKNMLIYIVMLFVGYELYTRKIDKIKWFKHIRELDLPFNYIASLIFVLFLMLYSYCSFL